VSSAEESDLSSIAHRRQKATRSPPALAGSAVVGVSRSSACSTPQSHARLAFTIPLRKRNPSPPLRSREKQGERPATLRASYALDAWPDGGQNGEARQSQGLRSIGDDVDALFDRLPMVKRDTNSTFAGIVGLLFVFVGLAI